ncbi:MAG TPA: aminoglycoside phosphotransferase family protein [Thermoanaerobaculia bacterium]|nr:aminoglycoside phosphotransferase family protein [Thermoanaerobaculia bacterium]
MSGAREAATPEDAAAAAAAVAALPSVDRLADCVRRGLGLAAAVPVTLEEIAELANINYVYRVETPGRTLYLKVAPERPKRLAVQIARERVFSEAEGLSRCRRLAAGDVAIPEVLFVDREEMALGMSDVGHERQVLFRALPERFDLLAEQAEALGSALGAIAAGTRGAGPLRPPAEEAAVRTVIFDGLLAPGARQLFPEQWDEIGAAMRAPTECLVHADLWSKNLLVRRGQPVAVVDFEGVHCGDPAFDLATLAAVALLPAFQRPALCLDALDFIARLLAAWSAGCGDDAWPGAVLPRAFRATATFLAARLCGPFAYRIGEPARQRLGDLARSLAAAPPAAARHFRERVLTYAAPGFVAASSSSAAAER